jgi:hypothetical protein
MSCTLVLDATIAVLGDSSVVRVHGVYTGVLARSWIRGQTNVEHGYF